MRGDELLPPVEPPSAGFILQLFVIPAVIVACVVGVWFVIESLARRDVQDADAIVAGLRNSSQARFQNAKELADMLRLPQRYPELKTNHELAGKLAGLLDEQIDAADDADAAITMRYFLAGALGEFNVDDGLPVLLKAARSDPERDVRRKAIDAIAVLAGSSATLNPPQALADEELATTLAELADDQDELVRSQTAFAIGLVAADQKEVDPQLIDALHRLSEDLYTDARFNAALALARIGDPQAAGRLAEMFDLEAIGSSLAGEKAMTEGVSEAALRGQKAFKRNTILHNALVGVDQVAKSGNASAADKARLAEAMRTFLAAAPKIEDPAPIPREILDGVTRGLAKLDAGAHR